MKKGTVIFWLIIVALIAGGIGGSVYLKTRPGALDGFAQCLGQKGATFYGAFWCPHCQAQKKLFGNSAKHLPYIECSTPDGQSQLDVCREKGVQQYPTWIFADQSTTTGEVALDVLAEKTGCELPQ